MIIYVVTGTETDAALMKAALKAVPPSDNEYKVISAGHRSSAEMYARSLLMLRKAPVILVVDADTMNDSRSAELERHLNRSLSEVGLTSDFKVIIVRPEIESLLFADRDIITELVGNITDEDFIKGRYIPRTVLSGLLNGRNLIEAIQSSAVADKIQGLHIKELDDLRSNVASPMPV